MRKLLFLCGLTFVMLLGIRLVQADDTGVPSPGTPADNECYPGGVLYREGNQDGCPTVWHWKAGWYLAQVNQGLIDREDVPDEFKSVLPPLPSSEGDAPALQATCTITIFSRLTAGHLLPEVNTVPLSLINGSLLSWEPFSWYRLNGAWLLRVNFTAGPFWVNVWYDHAWVYNTVVSTDCPTPIDPTVIPDEG